MKFHKSYSKLATGAFNYPMPDEQAKELDKFLDTGEYDRFERFSSSLEATSPVEKTDISIISDNSIDSDGEVFVPSGLNFERFQRNPVVSYNHNYEIPPIGKSLWQKLVGGTTWKAKTQYPEKPADFPESQIWLSSSIFHLVKEGYLPGKSIAGISKFRAPTGEEISKHGSGLRRVGYETIIYEYSIVNLNANKNAIVESVSKGLVYLTAEILSDFPELDDIMKEQKQLEHIVVKEFRTREDFLKEQEIQIKQKISELYNRTPEMVEDALAVMMGGI